MIRFGKAMFDSVEEEDAVSWFARGFVEGKPLKTSVSCLDVSAESERELGGGAVLETRNTEVAAADNLVVANAQALTRSLDGYSELSIPG